MMWYKLNVYRTHRGSGRRETAVAYIFARDIQEVMNRHRIMPGIKRNLNHTSFPDITELPLEEQKTLEKKILEEKRISLKEAKRTWYYSL